MAINKVIYGGKSLIDLTGDSVTPETLLSGIIAHDKTGMEIVGVASPDITVDESGNGTLHYVALSVDSEGTGSVS